MLEGLLVERGLRQPFEPYDPPEPTHEGRIDLRDLVTFTIDPETAKDFDDALSFRAEGDGLRAWVHIADVSAYVPAGSPLDRGAAGRALSTYVPGRVAPMLPPELADDLCSLRPHVDRLAVTVEVPFDVEPRPGRARLLPLDHPQRRAPDLRPRRARSSRARRRRASRSRRRCVTPSGSRSSCGGAASPAARSGSSRPRSPSPSTAAAASSAPGSSPSRRPTRSSRS